MQYQEIVQTVIMRRPEWNPQAVFVAIKTARDRTGCDMIRLNAVASRVANDPNAKTPAAIGHHPALAGGPLDSNTRPDGTADPDRPSLHPDLSGPEQLCAHGLDVRLRTIEDRPRCASCRGVTRIMRNGSDAPSRVDEHPPTPSKPRAGSAPAGDGDPEPWQAIAARAFPSLAARHGQVTTWGGGYCWRHDDRPVLPPWDECESCFIERLNANEWREAHGQPTQPPVRRADLSQ